jgi:hypothetical protein
MTSLVIARAGISARHVAEDAEGFKVAEKGDNRVTQCTSDLLCDLRAPRVLRVEVVPVAGNALLMGSRP